MFVLTQVGYMMTLVLYERLEALNLILCFLTIVAELALWLAFFPPAHYVRWIESRWSEADQRRAPTAAGARPS